MDEEKGKAYSEVVEILKLIDDEKKLEKIPFEVIELIKRNSEPNYKPEISKDIPIEEQNLRNETYSILAWIANKYWGKSVEETETQNQNEMKLNLAEEDQSEYPYNEIVQNSTETSNLPVIVNHEKWYKKIKVQIIKIFKYIFGIKDKNEQTN